MTKGIYKITNKQNNKIYIGKSQNIEQRWQYHIYNYKTKTEWNKPLYKAFRKYGIDNFSFEIIEEINPYNNKEADKKEKYWINYYDSFNNGYNATLGGDGGITCNMREKIGKLTEDDVVYLRLRYAECKYPGRFIFEKEFQHRISKRGFEAIWYGTNSKNIMTEVFTEENKRKQLIISCEYLGCLRRRISLEDMKKVKDRVKNKENPYEIWKNEYSNMYKSYSGFKDMLNKEHYDERIDLSDELSPL